MPWKGAGRGHKEGSLFVFFFAPFHFLAEFPDSADSRRPDPSNPKQLRVKKKKKEERHMHREGEREVEASLRRDNLKSVHRMYSGSSDALRSSDSARGNSTAWDLLHLRSGTRDATSVVFFFFFTCCLFVFVLGHSADVVIFFSPSVECLLFCGVLDAVFRRVLLLCSVYFD